MRVLHYNEDTFQLVKINPDHKSYAILSHTWGNVEDEVTYMDITNNTGHHKKGFEKLIFCRDQAARDGYDYFWIDTCCINKQDDAELSAAIRSMYRWYKHAKVCYVYLSGVSMNDREAVGPSSWQESFKACRWFTRGWTLQELIGSTRTEFFAQDGGRLGDKVSLCHTIHDVTGIHEEAIKGRPQDFSHLNRISWVAKRQTQRPEDKAYCMAGICGVRMDTNYGEGQKEAQMRLEDKIRRRFGSVAMPRSWKYGEYTPRPVFEKQQSFTKRQARLDCPESDATVLRRDTIKKASAEPCQGIAFRSALPAWIDDDAFRVDSAAFWVSGKPGIGKSILGSNSALRVPRPSGHWEP